MTSHIGPEDDFYDGIIGIGIISNYYNLNISVYCSDNNDPNIFVHFTNKWKDENLNNLMILYYDQRIEHFSILNDKNTQIGATNNQKNLISSKTNFKTIFNNIKDKNKVQN